MKINWVRKLNTKKIWRQLQNYFEKFFVVAIEKMLVIHFSYMEIVWLAFFFDKKFFFFI